MTTCVVQQEGPPKTTRPFKEGIPLYHRNGDKPLDPTTLDRDAFAHPLLQPSCFEPHSVEPSPRVPRQSSNSPEAMGSWCGRVYVAKALWVMVKVPFKTIDPRSKYFEHGIRVVCSVVTFSRFGHFAEVSRKSVCFCECPTVFLGNR